MSVVCALSVLFLLQVVQSQFTPVEWNTQVSSSQQCGSNTNPDLTSVLTTVASLVLTNSPVSSLPKSCLEIKDNAPSTPAPGYYTIMDAISATTNIVYCSMEDLSACPALEQAYQGLKSDYQSLSSTVANMQNDYNTLSTTASQGLLGLQNDLNTLSNDIATNYNTLSTTTSQGFSGLQNNLNTLSNDISTNYNTLSTTTSQGFSGLQNNLNTLSNDISTNYNTLSTTTSQGFSGLQNNLNTLSNTVTTNYQNLYSATNQGFTDLEDSQQSLVDTDDITSCEDIKNKWPWSTSGWYLIDNSTGSTHNIYCHMGALCGMNGPWTRVAYLDMTDYSQTCPPNFFIYNQDGVRACGKSHPISGGCTGTIYPTEPSSYTQICGRVIGYQYQRPDGTQNAGIDSTYVDGVSLTRGSPRQHIWTFAAEYADESGTPRCSPCAGGTNFVPSFVGNDIFCEAGNHNTGGSTSTTLYTDDPLWDGQQCGSDEVGCCDVPGPPWFYKTLDAPTDDYIELRICGNYIDEDSPVAIVEVYVM